MKKGKKIIVISVIIGVSLIFVLAAYFYLSKNSFVMCKSETQSCNSNSDCCSGLSCFGGYCKSTISPTDSNLPSWLEGKGTSPLEGPNSFLVVDKALCKTINSIKGFYETRNNTLLFQDVTCSDGEQISCFGVGETEHEGWYYDSSYVLYKKSLCPSRNDACLGGQCP